MTDREYSSIHYWIRKQSGKPTHCENCSKTTGKLEWSNVSQEYKRELSDWQMLCTSCHAAYDKYKDYCAKGHRLDGDNVYVPPKGRQRRCAVCNREAAKNFNENYREKLGDNLVYYRNHFTKETAINVKHMKGSISAAELARLYGVLPQRITQIWRGVKWKNI